MIRLEKRPTPSRAWSWATPLVAVLATMIAGGMLFGALGTDPFVAIRTIFWDPVFGEFAFYYRGQLLVKAGPLILIAVGLALGFRAGIWNIGAEGQYIIGAICGAAVGLAFYPMEARWLIFPLMIPVSITAILVRLIFKLKLADPAELTGLLDAATYEKIAEADRD